VERFYVRAGSINAVRKALDRAPGGAKVIGRFDRETIECSHTMEARSMGRHWPVLLSRLAKAGLTVVERPGATPSGGSRDGTTSRDLDTEGAEVFEERGDVAEEEPR
jgi:hypothetical protein